MSIVRNLLYFIVCLLLLYALYMVFFYAPIEVTMGVVQKIFYFHLGAAFSGFLLLFIVFVASIAYLVNKKEIYDIISISSAEIGVVMISIVLITGILWAKPVWNVWWTWDPRLTTTFVLWLIYVAYLLLRANLKDSRDMPVYAAVFSIIGFLDVPLVFMSIRWWRTVHPVIIRRNSISLAPEMLHTMLCAIVAVIGLAIIILINRIKLEQLKRRIDLYKNAGELL
jgi:heme exporter protein C